MARTLAIALLGGCTLALAVGLAAGPHGGVALACGSGNPVMRANDLLATLDPSTFNSNSGLPDTGGIFNLTYTTGQPIAFAEDLSYLNPGTTPPSSLRLRWKFGDSNSYVYTNAPSHTYTSAGTFLVYVEYFDTTSNSWQFFDYAHIHVVASLPSGTPPAAHATADATTIEPGTTITLDGSGSKAADGSQLTYTWDFNDGTRATGVRTTHTWVQPGQTLAELIVTDAHGVSSVDTINLSIASDPSEVPTAALIASTTTAAPGASVTYDASGSQPSANHPDAGIVSYVWDFGDGSAPLTTTGPTATHTFGRAGHFTVTVLAVDKRGAASSMSITTTVAAPPFNWTSWALGAAVLIVLVVGGIFLARAQRRYHALIRERERAAQLARSRRPTERRSAPQSAPGRSGAGSRPPMHATRPHGQPPSGR